MKILPDDVDADLDALTDKISQSLPEGCNVISKDEEPIAFGLIAIKLQVVIPHEMEGGTQPVEDAIMAVEGIQRVEVELVSLL